VVQAATPAQLPVPVVDVLVVVAVVDVVVVVAVVVVVGEGVDDTGHVFPRTVAIHDAAA